MDVDRLSDEQLLAVQTPPRAGYAFGEFYRRHESLVVAFHMRRVRNAEVAADLTSETFAQALGSRYAFRSRGDGSAAGWLYGIARFVFLRHVRRAEVEHRLERKLQRFQPHLEPDALAAIELASTDSEVHTALELLPPKQREAVRAYVIDDLTYEDIADASGSEPSAVRKRVSRGLAALRETFQEDR